jgi:hypothetical protein
MYDAFSCLVWSSVLSGFELLSEPRDLFAAITYYLTRSTVVPDLSPDQHFKGDQLYPLL